MANLVHSFLRNRSSIRIISKLTPYLITHQRSSIRDIESVFNKNDTVPLSNPVMTATAKKSDEPMRFYASFPFGCCLNPISIHGSGLIETPSMAEAALVEEEVEKEVVIYADSVKRKRKTKMNKHKYRKRRKLERRKT